MTIVDTRKNRPADGLDPSDEVARVEAAQRSEIAERKRHTINRPKNDFRPDIQGLRAVAVGAVVLFHAGLTRLSGGYVGVDVFFVISGFIITRQLLKELGRSGRISIGAFYARRMLRLLPAATFVCASTLAAAWLWMPPLRFREIATDALSTTFYGLNYRLAIQGTNYLSATAPPSPFQHFWSLAVEEQFYLVWPPLLLLAALCWRRQGRHHVADDGRTWQPPSLVSIRLVLVTIIAVSFALSVYVTSTSAPWAYFGAHTRAWELAIGALIAVQEPRLALMPRRLAIGLRWTGLATIAVVLFGFTATTVFPGYLAAVPVLAAGFVIAGGCREANSRILGAAPMQHVGNLSYQWYLWHWPVLIIGPYVFGALSLPKSLALAAMSYLLAYTTSIRVDQAVRDRAWLRIRNVRGIGAGLGLSAALAAMALLVPILLAPPTAGSGHAVDASSALAATSQVEKNLITLVASSAGMQDAPANLTPTLIMAPVDVGVIYRQGCDPAFASTTVEKPCMYGDLASKTTIVLFGDSHAGHWFPAVDAIAIQRHWRLAMVTKSACSAASALIFMPSLNRPFTECTTWRDKAVAYINSLHPAMVIMSSNGHGDALDVTNQDTGWADAWSATFAAIAKPAKLVLISDTAWPSQDIPDCVSAHLTDLTACARPRAAALTDQGRRQLVADAAKRAGATVIDPSNWMCTPTVCPPVIGNVLVYKDDSHISATFSRLLVPVLSQYIPTLTR